MIPELLQRLSRGLFQSVHWTDWFRLPLLQTRDQVLLVDLLLTLAASAAGGLIIFACCRFFYRGVPISHQLDFSLIPAAVLTTLVFHQSGTWPALSILLVVVLGFVHFRTVIKDLVDVLFVFWAILSGIFAGSGFPLPALAADAAIALAVFLAVNRRASRLVYLLFIRYDPRVASQLLPTLQLLHGKIRSQFEKSGLIDLTVEVRLRYISLAVVNRIAAMDGVQNAVMVSNDGYSGA